jgi:hypothetical protein
MSNTDPAIYPFPAAVVRPAAQEELRRLALERAVIDEAYVQKYNPYFWPAEISSTRLDAHGTRMDAATTLKNYAAEVEAGVSFLYSHDNQEIVGRSMGGRFINGQGNGVARVAAEFFAVPGLALGSVTSDQIIFAIDSKMLRDVSVGFYGGEWICSICGRDIWGMECRHWPLMKYEVEHDGKSETVMCTADVVDAHLAEVSGVYKGSTPGAAIGKAEREAKEGRLSPEVRRMLETRFQIHLPDKRVAVPGHSEERGMPEEKTEQGGKPAEGTQAAPPTAPDQRAADQGQTLLTSVRALAKEAGLSDDFADAEAGVRLLAAEVQRLRPLADDGTQYREVLTAAVVKEAVRAGHSEETYKALLTSAPLPTLRRMLDEFGAQGDRIFPGGRQTEDGTDLPDDPTGERQQLPIPPGYAAAYRG